MSLDAFQKPVTKIGDPYRQKTQGLKNSGCCKQSKPLGAPGWPSRLSVHC